MGTSRARRAPTGKFWRVAKSTVSRFCSPKNSGQISAAEVTARYVTALKESLRPDSQTPPGEVLPYIHKVAQNLGRFYQKLALQGLDQTLSEYDLGHLRSQPVGAVISALLDVLAGSGARLEEAVARSALIVILSEEIAETGSDYLSGGDRWLAECSSLAVTNHLRHFLAEAIFQKLASDLGEPLEAQAGDITAGRRRLQQLRRFIQTQSVLDAAAGENFELSWSEAERQAWITRQLRNLLARLEQGHGP